MNIFVIYKLITDNDGNVSDIEVLECDIDETNASRFSKLYNLQVPKDLTHRVQNYYQGIRVA